MMSLVLNNWAQMFRVNKVFLFFLLWSEYLKIKCNNAVHKKVLAMWNNSPASDKRVSNVDSGNYVQKLISVIVYFPYKTGICQVVPAILVVGKGRGGMFLFLLFLHFHSCSSFFPVPLFHLLYSLFYLFSPFLWETTQNDPQGLTCR